LKIGFVTTESPYGEHPGGGIAAYLRAIIPALLDGHQVTVFAAAGEERSFLAEDDRVRVHHFRLPAAHWYISKMPGLRSTLTLPVRQIEWSLAFYRKVAQIAARERIDVLEATELGALFLSRIAPLVLRLHGSEFFFRRHTGAPIDPGVRWNDSLEAISSRRAAAITTPSRFQANEIVKQRGWPADRIKVIPNPISTSVLEAGLNFQRNGSSESIVLYTGRLAPVKGIETLLRAAELVRESNPAVTFVLIGPWQMPHPPESYGLQLNETSANGVCWLGPRKQAELIDWYKRASLFVMPSYYESFGISVVEAMSFGLPVVCARVGAITETVESGVTGMLFEPGKAAELANTILKLVADRELRAGLGRAGQTKSFEDYGPARVARQSLEVYEDVRKSFEAA
jgi:glycosyltransferase involved in cell wall biosynthesis